MVIKQKLNQKQVQKMMLAPALQQAIKLLPLANLELIEVIDVELSQNPVLEEELIEQKVEPSREESSAKELDSEKKEEDSEPIEEKLMDFLKNNEDISEDLNFQNYIEGGIRFYSAERKEHVPLENILTTPPSLWDHLSWQANLTFFESLEREIAQTIVGNINEDGYLMVSEEEVAQICQTTVEKVREIREKIKMFDPVGTGSLDLKEVLLAQMDYLQVNDQMTRQIVREHLPLLEKSDFTALAKVLGISLQELKKHIETIKRLDPNPGRKYSQERTIYIVPDIIVTKEENELKVTLNDVGLPRLRINNYYRNILAKAAKENVEAYKFLKEKMKQALWFLRSLNQRHQTIYKVAQYVVNKQKEFFEKGVEYIKPMTLMEIAQEIGIHESTVGRVVANKYIMSPQGVFSLKYFFHNSLISDYGEEVSSLKIKERIKRLIENEDKDRPLSDIEVGEFLARENLRIARRTIAKYRKQLGIPPSHIRKRKFIMEGIS